MPESIGPPAAAVPGMRVLLASEPGAAERPNEDFAATIPNAVVLLDKTGYMPNTATRCIHDVA